MGIKHLSPRDLEQISAYLDGELHLKERVRIEKRLWNDPEWRNALDEMDRVRSMLGSLPRMRAPRNFTLSPEYARQKAGPRLYPVFGFASALAMVFLIAAVVGDLIGFGLPASTALHSEPPITTDAAFIQEAPVAEDASSEILTPTKSPVAALKMPATQGNSPEASATTLPSETPTEIIEVAPEATVTPEVVVSGETVLPTTTERETTTGVRETASPTPWPTFTETLSPTLLPTETQTIEPTFTATPASTDTAVPPTYTLAPTDTIAPQVAMLAESPQPSVQPEPLQPISEQAMPTIQYQIGDQPIWMILEIGLGLLVMVTAFVAWWNYRRRWH